MIGLSSCVAGLDLLASVAVRWSCCCAVIAEVV